MRPVGGWAHTCEMDEHERARAAFRAELPELLAALMPEDYTAQLRDVVEVGESEVSREQLLALLREQVGLQRVGSVDGRPEAARCGHMANAWRQVVYRQVRAVLTLFDAGLAVEAQPNARSALEHAVMLQLMADAQAAGKGSEFLRSLDAMRRKKIKTSLDRLGNLDARTGGQHTDLVKEAAQWMAESPERTERKRAKRTGDAAGPKPNLGTVRALFDGLPGGEKDFYEVYGKLSEGAHAGFPSAMPYLVSKELGLRPLPTLWAPALAVLSWACWAADDAMDEFLLSPQLAVRHEAITVPLGFVPGTSRRGEAGRTPEQ